MPDDRPWLRVYGNVPPSLDYSHVTPYEGVARAAQKESA
jgi:hypothetical protein